MNPRLCLTALLSVASWASAWAAADPALKSAGPGNYRQVITTLVAGDTLVLDAGVYPRGLPLTGCNGTPEAWITIRGPEKGVAEIRQSQVANCVELRQCSYLALESLHIQGDGPSGVPGVFGISAKGGVENPVHHIRIEGCTISDWCTSQQAVGISTKSPAWDWTIRGNIIRRCGTGLYLGNSNGEAPFIRGLIEHNLVHDPIGYCMEIKYQKPRPDLPGMPVTASRTIIRHNVFLKNDRPSPDGDRPNVLVGGFPDRGPGAEDTYEIYGNYFHQNPRESLLQASGRVTIHDNVFTAGHTAISLRDHDLPLKQAHVYHNTIVSAARGIRIASPAAEGHAVVGNVVFADQPLALHPSITRVSDNLTGPPGAAREHLMNPDPLPGPLDLHPKPGRCLGPPLDLSAFAADTDPMLDFDSVDKGERRFRGAYATAGPGRGWKPGQEVKPSPRQDGGR
jgi:hypothetical protein